MATSPKDRIAYTIDQNAVFDDMKNFISSAININQGDLCFLDTDNLIKAATGDSVGNLALGISRITIKSGIRVGPYTGIVDADQNQVIEKVPGPVFGVVASMKLKSGDSFVAGAQVYYSSVDAQTVAATGSNAIGVYVDVAKTGSGSNEGLVRLGNRYVVAGA